MWCACACVANVRVVMCNVLRILLVFVSISSLGVEKFVQIVIPFFAFLLAWFEKQVKKNNIHYKGEIRNWIGDSCVLLLLSVR